MKSLIKQIREKFPGIKFIINEITSRRDGRNIEVKEFNKMLNEYLYNQNDITIAFQGNLRDPS